MDQARQRLIRCFETVFPEAAGETMVLATPDSVERWDSQNHILLLNVIEEEFGFQFPPNAPDELMSFADLETFLSARASAP
ncbi:MAG TPA: acyl carrier protein [Bryobacteraceae bacterium]|jgi:acyl carrier protein